MNGTGRLHRQRQHPAADREASISKAGTIGLFPSLTEMVLASQAVNRLADPLREAIEKSEAFGWRCLFYHLRDFQPKRMK